MKATKIKPCEANLITALKTCAKSHKANFCDWRDEGQVGIEKECVPVFSDVQTILSAFYKPEFALAEFGWGYVTAYIYGEEFYNEDGEMVNPFLDEVDEMSLRLALPYNSKPRFVKV